MMRVLKCMFVRSVVMRRDDLLSQTGTLVMWTKGEEGRKLQVGNNVYMRARGIMSVEQTARCVMSCHAMCLALRADLWRVIVPVRRSSVAPLA